MSGIQIEAIEAHQEVVWVGCFEDNDSSRFQGSCNFLKKAEENIKREMFNDVKTCHCSEAFSRYGVQVD